MIYVEDFGVTLLTRLRKNNNKASIMWPSQNFLLHNGTVIKIKINEWINNKKIYIMSVPPFGDTYNLYKL